MTSIQSKLNALAQKSGKDTCRYRVFDDGILEIFRGPIGFCCKLTIGSETIEFDPFEKEHKSEIKQAIKYALENPEIID